MAPRKKLDISNFPLNPDLRVNGIGLKIVTILDAIDHGCGQFKIDQLTAVYDDLLDLCQKHNIPPEREAPKPSRQKKV